jgi:hypothetical protein
MRGNSSFEGVGTARGLIDACIELFDRNIGNFVFLRKPSSAVSATPHFSKVALQNLLQNPLGF